MVRHLSFPAHNGSVLNKLDPVTADEVHKLLSSSLPKFSNITRHSVVRTTVKVNVEWQNLTLSRPWTDRHQIWNTWLCRGYLLPPKIWAQSAQGILPHIPEIYTQNLRMFSCLLHFFQFFRAPTEKAVGPIFALNTSYDVVLRKEVPFGGEKN